MKEADMGVTVPLSCLIGSLLLVGLVSPPPVRHVIQAAPACVVLLLAARRTAWARFAVLPIYVVWLALMVCIWLFLLGIARVISGHFTPVEVVLTLAIGASCVAGLLGARR